MGDFCLYYIMFSQGVTGFSLTNYDSIFSVVKKLHQEVLTDTMSDKMSEISKELSNKRPTYKIIVVGDSGVGKTCLTYRFCSGKFPSRYKITLAQSVWFIVRPQS
jgi:hypothetical protein